MEKLFGRKSCMEKLCFKERYAMEVEDKKR
jgi:hypothetical protein